MLGRGFSYPIKLEGYGKNDQWNEFLRVITSWSECRLHVFLFWLGNVWNPMRVIYNGYTYSWFVWIHAKKLDNLITACMRYVCALFMVVLLGMFRVIFLTIILYLLINAIYIILIVQLGNVIIWSNGLNIKKKKEEERKKTS